MWPQHHGGDFKVARSSQRAKAPCEWILASFRSPQFQTNSCSTIRPNALTLLIYREKSQKILQPLFDEETGAGLTLFLYRFHRVRRNREISANGTLRRNATINVDAAA
jgi:hypothetical protein